MKNIVTNEQYAQNDLKPSSMIEQYNTLLDIDVRELLSKCQLKSIDCPSCASNKTAKHFDKFGLTYQECADCATLYVSPRPSDADISVFFKTAPSKIFWRDKLLEASKQSRKAKIIKPRLEWILDSAAEYVPDAKHWVDVHTAQERYLEAMAASGFEQKTVVAPYCNIKTPAAFKVIDQPLEKSSLHDTADVVTLFEVLDHASNPAALLEQVHVILKKGGLCFITCILSSGLDIKELGQHAKNIYPPDRLNVLSATGLQKLLAAHGFECLEFSTPGILDVDIVATAIKENHNLPVSPFIKDLVLNASLDVRASFQEFLQANLLSSYGRVLLRKV